MSAQESLKQVQESLQRCIAEAGRPPNSVELLPVSKGHPAEKIREMHALGLRSFGENYVAELLDKAEALKDLDIHWHYIGHIQSNKIRRLLDVAATVQTVSSQKHADKMQSILAERNQSLPIYLAVNAGNEPGKNGCTIEEAIDLAQAIETNSPLLELEGLMAVPPKNAPESMYHQLATLAKSIGNGKLSLGMSQDLEQAIEAGSTMVRIGTALFGPRPTKAN